MLKGIEEAYFRQKTRINWLSLGDQNTSYFHKVVMARAAYNAIHYLFRLDGIIASTLEDIANLALNHFKCILSPFIPPAVVSNRQSISFIYSYHCSVEEAVVLSKIPSAEEIKKVLFKMNPSKSPGPDGLTSGFYKAA